MFITDNARSMRQYLEVRGMKRLLHKNRKYLFLTSSSLVKDVVYRMEQFQYHGHAG